MKQVVVTDVRPPKESTRTPMLVGTGRYVVGGQPVTFAGDQHMMWDIRHALDAGDSHVVAIIEDWQIIGEDN